jgi:transcriptional regulator with XRE-family HTH domain
VVNSRDLSEERSAMTKETGMLVQKLRLQHGWSQEDLAELSTLSVRTIQRIERGRTASVESIKALASVFEVGFRSLKEPEMDKPAALSVDRDEALALAHVRRVKGFYHHAIQFAAMISALTVMNYLISPHHPWVLWVVVTWGSTLVVHGLQAFDKLPFLTAAWERRQVEKYMGRQL